MISFKTKLFLNSSKEKIINNKKVIENYFFMTILQILNSLFYLIIYPFLIRTLGADSYGHYVFAFSISVYFLSFVQFGFDTPALKSISLHPNDKKIHSEVFSAVFFCKLLLSILSLFVFLPLLLTINVFKTNYLLFIICYLQVFSNILFPTWYFQGIQNMKIVTYIQLLLKVISLPILFLFINSPSDIVKFSAITISTGLFGGVVAMFILKYKYSVVLRWIPLNKLQEFFRDALPFFLSSSMNTVKQQTATILIGSFFSMTDVALYDLAVKIYSIPTTLLQSVNGALFPKMMNANLNTIRNVIKIENVIGIVVVFFLFFFGKVIISIMGGEAMYGAYVPLVILSFGVFTALTVGAVFSFIFIPKGLYKYVAINQLYALIVFFLVAVLGLLLFSNFLIIPIAIAMSALTELIYCYFLLRQKRMLF